MLNDDYSVTLGRLTYTLAIAGVEMLIFWVGCGFIVTAGLFAPLLTAIFALRKDGKKNGDKIKNLEERIKILEDKII